MLTIKYTDGELIQNVDWNSLPNKPIKYMAYTIGKKTIKLIGYEKYLRLKEMVYGLNSPIKGIGKIILVGRVGDRCTKITVDLINQVANKEKSLASEIYNGKEIAESFWKAGQLLDNPEIYVSENPSF
jgi:hypothetical protein